MAMNGRQYARLGLAAPFVALIAFWLLFTNPFTMDSSEWGHLFFLCLMMGGAGVVGMVFCSKAVARKDASTASMVGLLLNGLSILFALGTLFG